MTSNLVCCVVLFNDARLWLGAQPPSIINDSVELQQVHKAGMGLVFKLASTHNCPKKRTKAPKPQKGTFAGEIDDLVGTHYVWLFRL